MSHKLWDPKSDRTETLTRRRPTRESKLVDSVKRPAYRRPADAPPDWEALPLDQKVPMPRGRGSRGKKIVLTGGRVGTKPLRPANRKTMDFDLDDPYMHRTSVKYNALHDPHLGGWLERNREHLRKQDLITENDEVVCTVEEHNDYRQRVRRQRRAEIARRRREEDAVREQKRQTRLADQRLQKEKMKKIRLVEFIAKRDNYKKPVLVSILRCIPTPPCLSQFEKS